MAIPRLYCPERLAPGTVLALPDKAAHHATRVLRMRAGETIILFNGDGLDYQAEILRIGKDGVTAKVRSSHATARESPLHITLAQAISSGDRMDLTLQKAVELGVAAILTLATERSVVKLSGERAERRHEHWQSVVASACEQSGRAIVPPVSPPVTLQNWLGSRPEFAHRIMLSPAANQSLHHLPAPTGPVCLLVGCEGGFSPPELGMAESCGFIPVRLGARVLRTESAALAALAAMQTLWGDF